MYDHGVHKLKEQINRAEAFSFARENESPER